MGKNHTLSSEFLPDQMKFKIIFLSEPPPLYDGTAVAVGCFDGLHIGHREVIRRLLSHAKENALNSILFTFSPHPKQLLEGGEFKLLMPFHEKIRALSKIGIDIAVVSCFDEDFATLSAQQFVNEYLIEKMNMKMLVVGSDHSFGAGRSGGKDMLRAIGKKEGFGLDIVEPVLWKGEPVKSTRIRKAVADGDLVSTEYMLGRPYSIEGDIVHGHGRGRDLGFPTVNFDQPENKLLPPAGVYAAEDAEGVSGLLYIGSSPTFADGDSNIVAEFYGLNEPKMKPGDLFSVSVFERFRDEIAFPNSNTLIEQMKADREKLIKWIEKRNNV